ncbi:O-acetylhomoserine -lyase protein [Halorhabdus tiamatea SARL4B]|uniref:CoA-binding domain protein n=1 Tax=Halorhabdus tiamatea SARL4B TaxID=1033806 RepID=F7PI52_9EURY|nr:CoA-binding protein [Halorhabdus tiamatea]ERJ06647.1 O-acetylhomoserine -lyase protein [Halorhabdus tiamatea SARL4B]CCQ32203.1 CoA-binding domain protein [Halorhabdus tiamatea SARL4B]
MPITDDETIVQLLETSDTIAVVGCSSTPGKAAHDIPKYLLEASYDVIPVNPFAENIFDRDAYDSLSDVPDKIDVVDVFRPSEEVPEIVEAALDRDDDAAIWLQEGITHDESAEQAEKAGRQFVQDRCMKVEHQRLLG